MHLEEGPCVCCERHAAAPGFDRLVPMMRVVIRFQMNNTPGIDRLVEAKPDRFQRGLFDCLNDTLE
jgi:hypothetical protein